jgi:hypothetical protein
MWTITEHEISEHKTEFTLSLPKDYQILSVLVKEKPLAGQPRYDRSGQPCLYVRSSIGEKEYEEVAFRNVQSGEKIDGPYLFIGSYQEVGYWKVMHLFRRVESKSLGEQTTMI